MNRYKKANEGIHVPEEVKKNAVHPAGKRSYTRWAGAVAAVLVVAAVGGFALWGNAGGLEDNPNPGIVTFSDPETGLDLGSGDGPVGRSAGHPEPAKLSEPPELSDKFSTYALSLASYPEMHPYPRDEDYFADMGDGKYDWEKAHDAYSEAYDAWWKDRSALWSRTDYTGMLDNFLTTSAPQFLTGAGNENRVYSPLNVYMALSMLAEITGGDSRQQLLDLLQVESIEDLRARAAKLWKDNYNDDGVVSSILSNSLWLRDDMAYSQQTLNTLATDYYASSFSGKMGSAEYDQALQSWINQQMRGLLGEQAGGLEMSPETVLALASTIYFKASWQDEFREKLTRPDLFHTPDGDVEVDFMRQTVHSGTYYWGEHFSAVGLGFRNSGVMYLILPDEGYTVDELLESGEAMEFLLSDKYGEYDEETDEYVGGWPGRKRVNIHLSMPKFDVSSDLDLIEGLKALGVTDVFDAAVSNFDPLEASTDDPLYVSKAGHAARVKVDEEGCEAAAFTVIMVAEGAAAPPDEEVDFVLDRPFLFVVTGSGLPLFTGVVNQPNG